MEYVIIIIIMDDGGVSKCWEQAGDTRRGESYGAENFFV